MGNKNLLEFTLDTVKQPDQATYGVHVTREDLHQNLRTTRGWSTPPRYNQSLHFLLTSPEITSFSIIFGLLIYLVFFLLTGKFFSLSSQWNLMSKFEPSIDSQYVLIYYV